MQVRRGVCDFASRGEALPVVRTRFVFTAAPSRWPTAHDFAQRRLKVLGVK